jgi:hypothetical protein
MRATGAPSRTNTTSVFASDDATAIITAQSSATFITTS